MANRRKQAEPRRVFVLDTNVMMHDPSAIFRFEEHDIFIPMTVLEELDAGKKGVSEAARNVRQVSRFLDELMASVDKSQIDRGMELPSAKYAPKGKKPPSGRLFFQTRQLSSGLPDHLPGHGADNAILAQTLALQNQQPGASHAGVEGHQPAHQGRDHRRARRGLLQRQDDRGRRPPLHRRRGIAGELLGQALDASSSRGTSTAGARSTACAASSSRTGHRTSSSTSQASTGIEAIVRRSKASLPCSKLARDYRSERHGIWGISARNREQNFALNLLLDPEIDLVTILGPAGTGKTLLTLAAGLSQALETNRYSEIIMTRVTIPLGEDIGFLPGTEEEKMEPWMGALMDNLEVLTQSQEGGSWGRAATNDLLRNRIKIRSLNFMRGRTFLNRYLILDEAQNLTPKQMKALVTRAGPGTKLVCLGNIAQIDSPYLSETTCGLTYVVNRFRGWKHYGHITLTRGERSRLADFASEML